MTFLGGTGSIDTVGYIDFSCSHNTDSRGMQNSDEYLAGLTSTCKFRKCTSVGPADSSMPLARTKEPLKWAASGDPYCSPEFNLVLLADKNRRAGLGNPKTVLYYEIERAKVRRRRR